MRRAGLAPSSGRSLLGVGNTPIPFDWAGYDSPVVTEITGLTGKDTGITYRQIFNMVGNYGLSDNPGAAFAYNDYNVMLGVKALQVAFGGGTSILETAFNTYLSELGVEDASDGKFIAAVRGGGSFHGSPRDFARFCLLWMNRGMWAKGHELLNWSFFTTVIEAYIAANLPISTDTTVTDYVPIGTFGGGVNQLTSGPGPNMYGAGLWKNNTVAETGNRAWPSASHSLVVCTGSGDKCSGYDRASGVFFATIGAGYGDLAVTNDVNGTFNIAMGRYNSAVTGACSYPMSFPDPSWVTATDSEAGLSTATLDLLDVGNGVIGRNGRLVRQWGDYDVYAEWASAGKPVLATLGGFAAFNGLI